jgi:hypothetical protein
MITLDRVAGWNKTLIHSGETLNLEIGYLPAGDFFYHLVLTNQYHENVQLQVELYHNNALLAEKIFAIHDNIAPVDLHFSIDKKIEGYGFFLHFTLLKGKGAALHLSVNPVYERHVTDAHNFLFGLDEKLTDAIRVYENVNLPAAKSDKKEQSQARQDTEGQPFSTEFLDAYIRAKYFRGFLSLNEATRQLDYVVNHKFMAPDGSRGFVKWKRKIYRKFVKFLYRSLTRNTVRKAYFAKLYRSYINVNLLSDNSNNDF